MTQVAILLKSTDFLTSDHQLFDEALVKWRFSTDIEALHERYARDWDETVPEDATIVILGDAIAYNVTESLDWYAERPGRKILITGNWDEINPLKPGFTNLSKFMAWSEVFSGIYDRGSIKIDDQQFLASHYTYGNAEKKPLLVEQGVGWKDTGMPLLHGHTHSRKRASRSKAGTLQIHVGIDAWKKPVSGAQILERAAKEGW